NANKSLELVNNADRLSQSNHNIINTDDNNNNNNNSNHSPKTPTNLTSDKKQLLQSNQPQQQLSKYSQIVTTTTTTLSTTATTVSTKYNPYVGASFRENRDYIGLVIGRAAVTPSPITTTVDMHQTYQSIERRPLKGRFSFSCFT
ncbi:unnamed protein product, partial [Schistosoma turkestanicum]